MADHRTVPARPTPYWESVGILDLGLHRQGVDRGRGWGAELQSKGKSRSFNHDRFFFSDRHKLSLPVIDPVFVHQLCSSLTAGSLGAHAGSGSIEYRSGRKRISQSCKLERAW
ncbi:hypothetical protein L208DRAFT_1392907 [Tricholoma matsutake]|nr:hypothetical protein L208DRAFT_1392907 [Tricholoma matsutake 945]